MKEREQTETGREAKEEAMIRIRLKGKIEVVEGARLVPISAFAEVTEDGEVHDLEVFAGGANITGLIPSYQREQLEGRMLETFYRLDNRNPLLGLVLDRAGQ